MDVLEMVFPGTLMLQHIDQQQNLRNNVSGSKCSSKSSEVGDISMFRVEGKPVHTASPNDKPKQSLKYDGCCQQSYDGLNNLSRSFSLDASSVNSTASSITDSANMVKPTKKISRKRNKKNKRKKNSQFTDNVVAETGPSECGQDIATASYQASKEKGHAEDDKFTVNCGKNTETVPPSAVVAFVCACEHTGLYLKNASNYKGKLISECSCDGNADSTGSHVLSDVWNSNHDRGSASNGIMEVAEGLNTIEKNINCCSKDLKENLAFEYLSQHKSYETNSMMSCTFEGCSGGGIDRTKSSSRCICVSNVHAVTPSIHDNMMSQSYIVNKPRCHHKFQTGKENSHSVWQKSRKHIRDASTHGAKRSYHIHVQNDVNSQEPSLMVKHNSFSGNALLPSPIVSYAGHNGAAHGVKEVRKSKQAMYSNVLVESSRWVAQHRFHGGLSKNDSELRQDDSGGNKDWGKSKEKQDQSFKHESINNSNNDVTDCKSNLFKLQNRTVLSQKEVLEVSREPHHYNNSAAGQRSINNNQHAEAEDLNYLHSYPISVAHVQLDVPHTTIPGVSDRALLPRVQPYTAMKIPRTEHVLVGSLHTSLDNLQRNPARLDKKLSYEGNIRQDFTSRPSLRKWIPVGTKDSGMLKNVGAVGNCNGLKDTPNSCKGKADDHLEEYIIPACEFVGSVDPGKTCLISSHETPRVMTTKSETPQFNKICKNVEDNHREETSRNYVKSGDKANGTPLLYIGSQLTVQALNAAYKLQIASESVQLATGRPLAEFERLLHCATPVIAPAFVLQHCDACLGNQLPHISLCKHQIPHIPLSAVWSWYEKPGNYGLEVKVEDSQNLKGLDTDSISFHAHFVPFLSAVQLFGHSHLSRRSAGHLNSEMPDSGEGERCSSPSKTLTDITCPELVEPNPFHVEEISASMLLDLVEDPINLSDVSPSNGNDSLGLSSIPACSDDMELIFEFFEYEQPQQRKPLYDKVMELIKAGTSNHQVFGDPSKLKCMNLHDLHPSSWYSVAWYPIYRIPGGNFRASFLTYHSLGYLVQRCSTDSVEENQFCIVSPVLGLQSYNVQGECWFYPKKPIQSSCKGFMPFNSSEILRERIRTLEETALLFARGCVCKDNIQVTNRQPDYEFFLSRKR